MTMESMEKSVEMSDAVCARALMLGKARKATLAETNTVASRFESDHSTRRLFINSRKSGR
jgi:hypothetical protein